MRTALSELLAEKGMTETQLMAAADLSPSTVNRYVLGSRGRRMNSQAARTVEKMADALDVEPDYFLEYRLYRIAEAMRKTPDLVNRFYAVLVAVERDSEEGTYELRSGQK